MDLVLSMYHRNLEGGVIQYRDAIVELLISEDGLVAKDEFQDVDEAISNPLGFLCKLVFFITLSRVNLFEVFFRKKFQELELKYKDTILYIPNLALFPHCYFKLRYCLNLHDLQDCYFPENFTFKERWLRKIQRKIIRRTSESIHCESESVKDDLIKFCKFSGSKIFVLPVPSKYFLCNENYTDVVSRELRHKNTIFYPASYWAHKNHRNLVIACSDLNKREGYDLRLVFTGGARAASLRKMIDELQLDVKCEVLGFASEDRIKICFHNSALIVVPSFFESISIPVEEAIFFGKKVIASNVCGMPEQLGKKHLFNPWDPFSIAQSIKEALDSQPADWKRYRENRLKNVNEFRDQFLSAIFNHHHH